jgi:succinate dehydrogenase/fumarate reductase cytochrome b subunit
MKHTLLGSGQWLYWNKLTSFQTCVNPFRTIMNKGSVLIFAGILFIACTSHWIIGLLLILWGLGE